MQRTEERSRKKQELEKGEREEGGVVTRQISDLSELEIGEKSPPRDQISPSIRTLVRKRQESAEESKKQEDRGREERERGE